MGNGGRQLRQVAAREQQEGGDAVLTGNRVAQGGREARGARR